MRKLVVNEFLTLDGVMQAPGAPDEDRSGGFEHGGWQLSYFDDVFAKAVVGGMAETGGLLFGRGRPSPRTGRPRRLRSRRSRNRSTPCLSTWPRGRCASRSPGTTRR